MATSASSDGMSATCDESSAAHIDAEPDAKKAKVGVSTLTVEAVTVPVPDNDKKEQRKDKDSWNTTASKKVKGPAPISKPATCTTCGVEFPSKNVLFRHLRDPSNNCGADLKQADAAA